MWVVRLLAATAAAVATAGPGYAGSPEADRDMERGLRFGCCGLPLIFGSLLVMVMVLSIRDARKPKL
jgi:hypothetical protein